MKFTESHEWVKVDGTTNIATVGITNYAQKELGSIVYVELPILNKSIKQGVEVAVLESTKAAADVYAPISGSIVEVNAQLKDKSELINESPEEQGWLFKMKMANPQELANLLDLDAYKKICK